MFIEVLKKYGLDREYIKKYIDFLNQRGLKDCKRAMLGDIAEIVQFHIEYVLKLSMARPDVFAALQEACRTEEQLDALLQTARSLIGE